LDAGSIPASSTFLEGLRARLRRARLFPPLLYRTIGIFLLIQQHVSTGQQDVCNSVYFIPMESRAPRLLLLDDHVLFAEGLAGKLQAHGIPCDTAATGEACLQLLNKNEYRIWLCDINLPGINGLDFIRQNRPKYPVRIFLVSAYNEPYLIEKAKKLGIAGFITKTEPFEVLLEAISQEHSGFVVHPAVNRIPIGPLLKSDSKTNVVLTPQERKIIQLVVDGLSSKEIADKLFISKYTVDTHRRNILKKMDAKSVSAMIRIAHAQGLVD
jgi:two-component system nitrate/nitrite response regulator NarL